MFDDLALGIGFLSVVSSGAVSLEPPPSSETYFLLQEDGSRYMKEDGSYYELEH